MGERLAEECIAVDQEKQVQAKGLLHDLYEEFGVNINDLADIFFSLCVQYRQERPQKLQELDKQTDPLWYQSAKNVGYIMYADLFAPEANEGEYLKRVRERLDYLQELGVSLVHILPALKSSGDAGFAVDDYRKIDERLGTMADFERLTAEAHQCGIRIAFDFVLNHTSDNHPWAEEAKKGDKSFQDFYIFREDKPSWPAAPDVFPDHSPGWWDYVPELKKWVLSTFYKRRPHGEEEGNFSFAQWDLNYKNPQVLLAMMENLFFLANQGVDTFRLDAVPYLWKEEGTNCQSLKQVHTILKLMRLGLEEVAPRATFLAEACQPPQDLVAYFGQDDEVQQAYHFTLMPALWHALATGNVAEIKRVWQEMPSIPELASWMIFSECHDEVSVNMPSEDLSKQLWEFFVQNGGKPFRMREGGEFSEGVSGTTYTLLGGNTEKIALLWAVKMSLGGTPLIYMGEELGAESDESYLDDPVKASDSRFVKRVPLTDETRGRRHMDGTKQASLFSKMQELISWRKQHPVLASRPTLFETKNSSVLGYWGQDREEIVVMLANFSGQVQEASLPSEGKIELQPYQFLFQSP